MPLNRIRTEAARAVAEVLVAEFEHTPESIHFEVPPRRELGDLAWHVVPMAPPRQHHPAGQADRHPRRLHGRAVLAPEPRRHGDRSAAHRPRAERGARHERQRAVPAHQPRPRRRGRALCRCRGRARPGAGSFEAISQSSQLSAFGPDTSKREKPLMSSRPTPSRTAMHSSATIANALERFSDGVSAKPRGAK